MAHDTADEAGVAEELLHDRGRELVERYGCARCHAIPGIDRSRRPGLAMPQASQMNRDWVAKWLRDPQAVRPGTRMGAPGGTPAQVEELISILLVFLEQPEIIARIEPRWRCGHEQTPADPGKSLELARAGRARFYELGCSACHSAEKPASIDVTRSPSLAEIGSKWSAAYLRQLLADPLGRHANGGMPDFKLDSGDLEKLVAYLATFRGAGIPQDKGKGAAFPAGTKPGAAVAADPQLLERGKQIIQKRGCYACHHHPENRLMEGPRLATDASRLSTGCLRASRSSSIAPFFTLSAADRAAIVAFLTRRPEKPVPVASGELAEQAIRERLLCFACHARDGAGGEPLASNLADHLGKASSLPKAALTAPDVSGSGARLLDSWLSDSVAGKTPSNRPWLTVRMPRFSLDETNQRRIAKRLAFADWIPDLATPHNRITENDRLAGQRLIGAGGFNCVNCHYLGNTASQVGKSAPDLTWSVARVSGDWFDRWLTNPARILPGTPMPAFTAPIPGIAGDDLAAQKRIFWYFLEQSDPRQSAKSTRPKAL